MNNQLMLTSHCTIPSAVEILKSIDNNVNGDFINDEIKGENIEGALRLDSSSSLYLIALKGCQNFLDYIDVIDEHNEMLLGITCGEYKQDKQLISGWMVKGLASNFLNKTVRTSILSTIDKDKLKRLLSEDIKAFLLKWSEVDSANFADSKFIKSTSTVLKNKETHPVLGNNDKLQIIEVDCSINVIPYGFINASDSNFTSASSLLDSQKFGEFIPINLSLNALPSKSLPYTNVVEWKGELFFVAQKTILKFVDQRIEIFKNVDGLCEFYDHGNGVMVSRKSLSRYSSDLDSARLTTNGSKEKSLKSDDLHHSFTNLEIKIRNFAVKFESSDYFKKYGVKVQQTLIVDWINKCYPELVSHQKRYLKDLINELYKIKTAR